MFSSDSLVAHSNLILFSAAVPGQGGEFHVNEQPYEYWREKFATRGFTIIDCLRSNIKHIRAIEPWYRYNMFLYIHLDALDRLPPTFRQMQLANDACIADVAPFAWRLRNSILRRLPPAIRSAHGPPEAWYGSDVAGLRIQSAFR
jgi:hypothetical protein